MAKDDSKARACSNCGKDKPAGEFPKIGAQCKACIAVKAAATYQAKKGGKVKPAKASTVAKSIANLRAKTNGAARTNGTLLQRQYLLKVRDVEGDEHVLILDAATINTLATELRSHT